VDETDGGIYFLFDAKWALARHGSRGGKNTRHTFAAKTGGGLVPWRWRTMAVHEANNYQNYPGKLKVRRDKRWRPTKHPLSLGKYYKPELRQRGGIGKTANK
jgi:hypothetical protein